MTTLSPESNIKNNATPLINDVPEDIILECENRMQRCGFDPTPESRLALIADIKGENLLIAGPCGVGKSFFERILERARDVFKQQWEDCESEKSPCDYDFKERNIISLQNLAMKPIDEVRDIIEQSLRDELVLEDVGAEPKFGTYGGKIELFPWILEERLLCGQQTHITTNLNRANIAERYGDRVHDRLTRLFTIVNFTGESHRHVRTNTELLKRRLNIHKQNMRYKQLEEDCWRERALKRNVSK